MPAKKAAAKKTAAKKVTTKKVAAKKASAKARPGQKTEGLLAEPVETVDHEAIAERSFRGEFGTGRERDIALRSLGADPSKVSKIVARLRVRSES